MSDATRKHDPDPFDCPFCGHPAMQHGGDGKCYAPDCATLACCRIRGAAPSPSPRSGRTLREEIGALCGLGRVVGPAELAWALDNCPDCASPRSPRATPDRAEVERAVDDFDEATIRCQLADTLEVADALSEKKWAARDALLKFIFPEDR